MNEIPSEDEIHQMYSDIQRQREMRFSRRSSNSNDPNAVNPETPQPFTGRQAFVSNQSRFNQPSFRSDYFNKGEGLQTLDPGETKVLAQITVPAQYAGVLTGFSQFFANCDEDPTIPMSVTWHLRINGLPPLGFADFVGEYSSLMLPHSIYFPLIGGAATLGETQVSLGGKVLGQEGAWDQDGFIDVSQGGVPTVSLAATNNNSFSVILQGRLVGYTFPVAERNDEFQNF